MSRLMDDMMDGPHLGRIEKVNELGQMSLYSPFTRGKKVELYKGVSILKSSGGGMLLPFSDPVIADAPNNVCHFGSFGLVWLDEEDTTYEVLTRGLVLQRDSKSLRAVKKLIDVVAPPPMKKATDVEVHIGRLSFGIMVFITPNWSIGGAGGLSPTVAVQTLSRSIARKVTFLGSTYHFTPYRPWDDTPLAERSSTTMSFIFYPLPTTLTSKPILEILNDLLKALKMISKEPEKYIVIDLPGEYRGETSLPMDVYLDLPKELPQWLGASIESGCHIVLEASEESGYLGDLRNWAKNK